MDEVFEYDFSRNQFIRETKSEGTLEELKILVRSYYRKL
jgi:hypothetical protein